MKAIKLLGIVVLGIGLLLGINFFLDSSGKTPPVPGGNANANVADLSGQIDTFELKSEWDYEAFKLIRSRIKHNEDERYIRDYDAANLTERLEKIFCVILNREATEFLKQCSPKGNFSPLRSQVGELFKKYPALLQDCREDLEAYGSVLSFYNRVNSYLSSGFNTNLNFKYYKELDVEMKKSIIKNCSLKDDIMRFKAKLEEEHIKYLENIADNASNYGEDEVAVFEKEFKDYKRADNPYAGKNLNRLAKAERKFNSSWSK